MHEAQPSALRNREPEALALIHVMFARCGLVLSRDHLPDFSVYYGSNKSYSSSNFLQEKWLVVLLPLSVTPRSCNCVLLLLPPEPMRALSGELNFGLIGQEHELLTHAGSQVSPATPLLEIPVHDFAYWLGKFVLEISSKKGPSTLRKHCMPSFVASNGILKEMKSMMSTP